MGNLVEDVETGIFHCGGSGSSREIGMAGGKWREIVRVVGMCIDTLINFIIKTNNKT